MSRNEGEEEEELFVFTVSFCLKAHLLLRVTVVREGMSGCEGWVIRNTFQSDSTRILKCQTTPHSSE